MNLPNRAQIMPMGRQGMNLPTLPIYYIYGQGRAWFSLSPGEHEQIDSLAHALNETTSRERLRNLLLNELSCLVWVSYVISEPGRKSLNAPKRRRGCGICAQGAVSEEPGCWKSSTKRTRRASLGSDQVQSPTWRS